MAALGKELVYEGRLQQEEASREKKQEMKTALILETAKAKLENLNKQDQEGNEDSVTVASEVENDTQIA